MNISSEEVWKEHYNSFDGRRNTLKTKIELQNNLNVYLATIFPTNSKALMLEILNPNIIKKSHLKKFKGVEIKVLDSDNTKPAIAILLTDNELLDLFILFTDEIIKELDSVVSEQGALECLYNQISKWRKLFITMNPGLSVEEQMGLMGELSFIKDAINNSIDPNIILNYWAGPENYIYDFLCEKSNIAIEIKALSQNSEDIQISNETQLDEKGLYYLKLVIYKFSLNKHNGSTLPDLIKEIESHFNSASISKFHEKLVDMGYDQEEELYYNRYFNLKQRLLFYVEEGFPRIIDNNLPTGVKKVKYSIALANCMEFEEDYYKIFDKIR